MLLMSWCVRLQDERGSEPDNLPIHQLQLCIEGYRSRFVKHVKPKGFDLNSSFRI